MHKKYIPAQSSRRLNDYVRHIVDNVPHVVVFVLYRGNVATGLVRRLAATNWC